MINLSFGAKSARVKRFAVKSGALVTLGTALFSSPATAAPVTYFYDSGAFTSSPRAQTPRFGTHFTAALTFSDDLIPGTLGFDYLNRVSEVGNPPGPFTLYQHASLLDWTVTSGEFTLDARNATITADLYSFTSASTSFIPIVYLSFDATTKDIIPGGTLPVDITARSDLNITSGIGPYPGSTFSLRNFNLGGGLFTKLAVPVGTLPEPSTWGTMLLGFGLIGTSMRRRTAAGLTAGASPCT